MVQDLLTGNDKHFNELSDYTRLNIEFKKKGFTQAAINIWDKL